MIRSTDLCVHHSAPPTNRRCPPSPNSGVDMKAGEYGGKKGGQSMRSREGETRRGQMGRNEDHRSHVKSGARVT